MYHDDGYVKHGLPTAAAVTVMLWGLVDYQKAYESTGELKFGRKQLRWALDYYMKAHTAKDELHVQVKSTAAQMMNIAYLVPQHVPTRINFLRSYHFCQSGIL